LLLLAPRPLLAAEEVADYVSPETKVVLGLQMRTIAPALAQAVGPELLAQARIVGFDPLKDLDEVILMTNGSGDNPPVFAVLRGRFDLARLGRDARPYMGVPIVQGPGQANGTLALVDAGMLFAGDPGLVRAAIARRLNGIQGSVTWADQIESLRAKYPVWGIGEGMDSVDRFHFGAEFQDGLTLTAELHVTSAPEMEKLTAGLHMLEAMAKSSQANSTGSRFEISTEGGTLRLALHVPADELKKSFQAQRGPLEAALLSRLPGLAKPSPRPAAPGGTIVSNPKGETMTLTLPGAKR
jgi:hypothetical protein